ncbi:hypothetical protein [Botrimarina hoheduenensis]|uniref:Uncharacterized protein n=1 Tax=Botrimarina hoheduenensis TaxID=2528000 RepID=A0A5C5W882_9BACT|nr:hypothetical protein [Botrimarina hoheduenensis]TWT46930.1 hypothetical protein Pla111_20320 [Botrimarina hoheduenensis]
MPKDGDIGGTIRCGGLQITFIWQADRYTHQIVSSTGCLRALADEADAETPVYTDLHQQGELLFVSGMSGDRHWSASVEPTAAGLVFDLACRTKSAADGIGVIYRGNGARAVTLADDRAPVTVETVGERQTISPLGPLPAPPLTLRLRYQISA